MRLVGEKVSYVEDESTSLRVNTSSESQLGTCVTLKCSTLKRNSSSSSAGRPLAQRDGTAPYRVAHVRP
ncbi:unnamed protein product [Lampetra fluviatilis]